VAARPRHPDPDIASVEVEPISAGEDWRFEGVVVEMWKQLGGRYPAVVTGVMVTLTDGETLLWLVADQAPIQVKAELCAGTDSGLSTESGRVASTRAAQSCFVRHCT
jgi:hypothetical protein